MKQPATLPTLRRQGAALTVLALAVVLAALAGLCFGSQGYTPLQLWQGMVAAAIPKTPSTAFCCMCAGPAPWPDCWQAARWRQRAFCCRPC